MGMKLPGRKPRVLERTIQRDVLAYLRAAGWLAMRMNSGGMTATYHGRKRFVRFNDTPGLSDVLAIKDGRFLCVEVKRPGERMTTAQAVFLDAARAHGAIAVCVSSLDQLAAALDAEKL